MLGVKKCAQSQGFRDRSDVIDYLQTQGWGRGWQLVLLTSQPSKESTVIRPARGGHIDVVWSPTCDPLTHDGF